MAKLGKGKSLILEGLMKQLQVVFLFCTVLIAAMLFPQRTDAIGLSGANIKAGVNLTRQQSYTFYQGVGGEFDSHQWMVGTNLDLGSVWLPKLHFMPGVDFALASVKTVVPPILFTFFIKAQEGVVMQVLG
jgi:hypothetical protein